MQKQKTKQKQVQKQNIIELIDESYLLDTEIKEKTKVLKDNKEKLKHTALIEGKTKLSGELIDVIFSNDTKTEIDPKKFYELLVELNMEAAFWDLISVKIGDARKRVGDMALESIWNQTTKKANKISFKKKEIKNESIQSI
jgi:hypothetical protein